MLKYFFFLLLLPPLRLSFWLGTKRTLPLWLRVLGIVLFFLISQQFTLNRLFFGALSGPDMPHLLLLCQSAALTALVIAFFCVLAQDLWHGLAFLAGALRGRKSQPNPGRRAFCSQLLVCSVPALGIGAGISGVVQGTSHPACVTRTVHLAHRPSALQGLRIALLTDLHVGPLTDLAWARGIVARVREARPDLICLAGDLSDGQLNYRSADGSTRQQVASCLGELSAPLGVFACTGNHEYYSDYTGWMQLYQRLGFRFLHNTSVMLTHNGASFVLGGRDDRQSRPYFHRPTPSVEEVFSGQPWHGEQVLRILLDHRPDRAFENAACADLQLSGHTHGGQCLGFDRLVARVNHGFLRGWYTVEDMQLYVCPGTGLWSGFPVRLGVASEIALITLA